MVIDISILVFRYPFTQTFTKNLLSLFLQFYLNMLLQFQSLYKLILDRQQCRNFGFPELADKLIHAHKSFERNITAAKIMRISIRSWIKESQSHITKGIHYWANNFLVLLTQHLVLRIANVKSDQKKAWNFTCFVLHNQIEKWLISQCLCLSFFLLFWSITPHFLRCHTLLRFIFIGFIITANLRSLI